MARDFLRERWLGQLDRVDQTPRYRLAAIDRPEPLDVGTMMIAGTRITVSVSTHDPVCFARIVRRASQRDSNKRATKEMDREM